MAEHLPGPLVPAEVDLRGYEFMNLYGDRLFKSTTWISAKAEAKVAMLQLWWHAFAKEIPAASLPQDDQLLANYAGFGISIASWRKARAQVLRGFVACSDGRLYHPFLAEIALGAWKARLADRLRGAKARIGATQKRLTEAKNERDKAHISGLLQTQEHELSQLLAWSVTADRYTLSQGQKGKERIGEDRKGENLGSKTVAASNTTSTGDPRLASAPSAAAEKPEVRSASLAGAMAVCLRSEGVTGVTPSHPIVVGWAQSGITVQLLREAVDLARERKPKPQPIPVGYLEPIVTQLLQPAKPINGVNASTDWWATTEGIIAEATKRGIPAEGKSPTWLRCAIAVAQGGDHWQWIDPRNGTEERLILEIRKAQTA